MGFSRPSHPTRSAELASEPWLQPCRVVYYTAMGYHFLRASYPDWQTVLAYTTPEDRDSAVLATRRLLLDTAPVSWDEICKLIAPEPDGTRLIWGDFPGGGWVRI